MKNHFSNKAITKAFAEIASFDSEYTDPSFDPTTILVQLARANTLLDQRNKSRIFLETLSSLNSKSACERAAQSFDSDYWVSIPLSWESTLELLKEVIGICKKYNTNIPASWLNLTDYNMDNSNLKEDVYTASRAPVNV
jgi:hypothetical protein